MPLIAVDSGERTRRVRTITGRGWVKRDRTRKPGRCVCVLGEGRGVEPSLREMEGVSDGWEGRLLLR